MQTKLSVAMLEDVKARREGAWLTGRTRLEDISLNSWIQLLLR